MNKKISCNEYSNFIDETEIPYSSHSSLNDLDWEGVDVVIECTGKFKSREHLEKHLKAGAKKVILSVPPLEDDIKTIVLGVNDQIIDAKDTIISNVSCTKIGRAHV